MTKEDWLALLGLGSMFAFAFSILVGVVLLLLGDLFGAKWVLWVAVPSTLGFALAIYLTPPS